MLFAAFEFFQNLHKHCSSVVEILGMIFAARRTPDGVSVVLFLSRHANSTVVQTP
jgi:hypothetical protein